MKRKRTRHLALFGAIATTVALSVSLVLYRNYKLGTYSHSPLDAAVRYQAYARYNSTAQQWEITDRISLVDVATLNVALYRASRDLNDSALQSLRQSLETAPTSLPTSQPTSTIADQIPSEMEDHAGPKDDRSEKLFDALFFAKKWKPISVLDGVMRFERNRIQPMTRNALDATNAKIPTLSETIFEGTREVRLVPDTNSTFSLVAPPYLVGGTQPAPTTRSTNAVDDTVPARHNLYVLMQAAT